MPASLAAARSDRVPCFMIRSNASVGALDDRDQVDDDVAALDGAAQARLVGHVAGDELAASGRPAWPRASPSGSRTSARTSWPSSRIARTTWGPDEPGAAGDEDAHQPPASLPPRSSASSGWPSGPAWPWYFEPIAELPYGLSAGSVICTNEIWPIFIPK